MVNWRIDRWYLTVDSWYLTVDRCHLYGFLVKKCEVFGQKIPFGCYKYGVFCQIFSLPYRSYTYLWISKLDFNKIIKKIYICMALHTYTNQNLPIKESLFWKRWLHLYASCFPRLPYWIGHVNVILHNIFFLSSSYT